MGFGGQIKSARDAKGMSGEAVGTQLGVTKATISKWENEQHDPSVKQIKGLCEVLDVTPDWLFEWQSEILPSDAIEEAKVYAKLSAEDRRRWKALRKAMFTTASSS